MLTFKPESVSFLTLLDRVAYLFMLGLGVYFINQGNVIQKFQMEGTNFGVYEEQITELPTIVTYMEPDNPSLKYGKDFKIEYHPVDQGSDGVNLTFGSNTIGGLKLDFYQIPLWHNRFKVTPMNFPTQGASLNFKFTFFFESSINMSSINIGFTVSTENGSQSCEDGRFHDGDVDITWSRVGFLNDLIVFTKKDILLADKKHCRQRPYNDLLIEKFLELINDTCKRPCHVLDQTTKHCNAFALSKDIMQMDICKSGSERKCSNKAYRHALNKINHLPCTKLHYQVKNYSHLIHNKGEDRIVFNVVFEPNNVKVTYEYIIYDLVATISAVGGTMGLCIGFSFADIISSILAFTSQIAMKIRKSDKNNDVSQIKP